MTRLNIKNKLPVAVIGNCRDSNAELIRNTCETVETEHGNLPCNPIYSDDYFDEQNEHSSKEAINLLVSEKFASEIKIDFIKSIDYRILCRFLGLDSVTEVKNYPYKGLSIVVNLLEQVTPEFMKSEGFAIAGELNFDNQGNSIPVEKKVWKISGKEEIFNISGFSYYEKLGGKRKDNIVFLTYYNSEHDVYLLSCYSSDEIKCEQTVNKLEQFAKNHNCLRSSKLKDIDVHASTFSIVESNKKYTWDNYYYPEGIKDLFENEIFGFLRHTEKYNKFGITKRGVILHGKPGTGKTSIGHLICNEVKDNTVIWITPEMVTRFMNSIKEFYQLADFVSPCIIMLEDLDLFGTDREQGGDIHRLGTLMNILDGVNSINNSVTIATTNRLESIEKALRNRPGRFDRIIEIPALNADLRSKMFTDRLSIWTTTAELIKYLVDKTKDWTGAQVQEFVNTINLNFITQGQENKKNEITKEMVDKILDTMLNFGVSEQLSKSFGFGQRDDD